MGQVFLSYAREDAETARRVAESVAAAGHDVWWDHHLHGGSRFAAEIDRALKEADAVVVLWSESSVASAWVQDEAAEGRDSGRLVPVSLGSAKPPLGFRQFHTVELDRPDRDTGLRALLDSVARVCGSEPEHSIGVSAPPRRASTASICVLPFANMSGDPEQEYFSDGISEDIITDLSKVSALSVIARNTAFTFKGRSVDVTEVARKLGVTHVLEGSVRKAGARIRVTAQLIDGSVGDHVWADRYDRDLTDIFEIQDELSRAIVAALQVKLLPEERKAIETRCTCNVDAYNLYLLARQHWISGVYGDVRKDRAIVRICRQAVLLDPDYAKAWALMALAQAELRFWNGTSDDALPAAERALAIDPELPEARCVRARYLEQEGREEEADAEVEAALRREPDSWEVNREAARLSFREGRITEAIVFFEKASQLMSGDFHSPAMLTTCYTSTGQDDLCRDAAQRTLSRCQAALAKDPANGAALAAGAGALLILDEHQRAKEWVDRALLLDPDNHSTLYNLACAYAAHGHDVDGALDILEQFFERMNSDIVLKHLDVDPDLDSLREHPRFIEMVAAAKRRRSDHATAG